MTWTPADAAEAEVRDAARAAQQANANPVPNLLSVDDPDWAAFQSDDPEWYLRAAGTAIRTYCGWHVFPNKRENLDKLRVGSKGIISLPSAFVTQVDSLAIRTGVEGDDHFQYVHPDHYTWDEGGWIELRATPLWMDWYAAGYYYGGSPSFYYLPIAQPSIASCTFWSGHHALPDDVKEVAFELAEQAMTVRAGNIKTLMSPGGYRADTTQPFGLTLNPDQKNRIASYRIGMVG